MAREPIPVDEFVARVHHLWEQQWLLLAAGDLAEGRYNAMTVAWGSLGTMWGKPFALVVVRPVRYTFEFMEQYSTFTLCAFSEHYRDALQLLGTRSGRDGDKIAEAGLKPIPSSRVAAPGFAEADLIIECRKTYWSDLDPTHFVDPTIDKNYARRDYHRVYFGEVVAIAGTAAYRV
jgi:flavin reductase (DIM6/NTAB) family NADH-FMN oxidoreductase RutF